MKDTKNAYSSQNHKSENILTQVTVYGVVIPQTITVGNTNAADFRLVAASGVEYLIVADSQWREVLSQYRWLEVKVKGLLNIANRTIVVQRVFPKGPTGERNNVTDLADWKGRDLIKKLTKNVSDFVLVPAAVFAVLNGT